MDLTERRRNLKPETGPDLPQGRGPNHVTLRLGTDVTIANGMTSGLAAVDASFGASTNTALAGAGRDPKTKVTWTTAGVLVNAISEGQSIENAFQQVADLGRDAGNTKYGSTVSGIKISGRLDCLKQKGSIQ